MTSINHPVRFVRLSLAGNILKKIYKSLDPNSNHQGSTGLDQLGNTLTRRSRLQFMNDSHFYQTNPDTTTKKRKEKLKLSLFSHYIVKTICAWGRLGQLLSS